MTNDEGTSNPTPDEGNEGADPTVVVEPSAPTPDEGNVAPRKYAGMYDSPEQLEAAHKSLQSEYQKVKSAPQPSAQPEIVDPEVEAAVRFVDERVNERLAPITSALEEQTMRGAFPDFDSMKEKVQTVQQEVKGISLLDAYKIAKGREQFASLSNVIAQDNAGGTGSVQDAGKAATVSQRGTQPSSNKGLTPGDVMNMPVDEYKSFMASPAGQEYLEKRSKGEI